MFQWALSFSLQLMKPPFISSVHYVSVVYSSLLEPSDLSPTHMINIFAKRTLRTSGLF